MRSLILIFTLFISLFFNQASASQNYLNEVVLENSDSGYNVILRVDSPVRVKKTILSGNAIVLSLKDTHSIKSVTTLYKNIPNQDGVVVENLADGDVEVRINAEGIANANVILNTPNAAPLAVGDRFAKEKIAWTLFSIAFILISVCTMKDRNRRIVRKMNMRDREIEFYKATLPSINYRPKYYSTMNSTTDLCKDFKTLRQYQDLSKV